MDMEKERFTCAVLGQPPMRFPWGFDEEDTGCQELKLALAQKIMELRQHGVTRFAVVADCGVGLYAGECVNALRQTDRELMLFVVTPHEEQATKWAPYLRERYFKLLEDCTIMDAYCKIIDYADMILAVYDPAAARDDAVDHAMEYAKERELPVVSLPSDEGC